MNSPLKTWLGSLAVIGALAAAASPASAATAWPGSSAVSIADDSDVFGQNLSGLAYRPSGSSAPGVLWAVRNSPSSLFRLVHDGTKWKPDTANGWAAGKTLTFPNGGGVPDAEGVTFAAGDANGIYVSIERNQSGPAADISRPAVLRYDITAPGGTLVATQEWDLTVDLPGLGRNAGLEALTWIPDDVLVAKGLFDESAGTTYNPAAYDNHGAGLFFVGLEQNGQIIAYALNHKTGGFTRIATIDSGFPRVMELTYDAESAKLWAICDNDCNGLTSRLDVAGGRFAVTDTYERPAGMENLNNEGFAIAPEAECVNDLKPVFYTDDDNGAGHALRTGAIDCLSAKPRQSQPTITPQPTPTPAPVVGVKPSCCGYDAAPQVTLALKFTKSGQLRTTITLNERADLTITAKTKRRTVVTTTRKGFSAGKRSLTLGKKRSVRRGETVTLTVKARDAAGNVTTRRVSAKVR